MLPLLIARSLGQLHSPSYDLATAVPDEKLHLDAVQAVLVEAAFLVPVLRHLLPGSPALRAHVTLAGPCPEVKEETEPARQLGNSLLKKLLTNAKVAKRFSEKLAEALELKELVDGILDGLHGSILAFSVKISREGPAHLVTHYGPAGHAAVAGKPMVFQMKVVMQDELRESVINCLALAGLKFPKKGPIPGVTVVWTPNQNLQKYGTFSPAPSLGILKSTTDDEGIATLTFTPKNEPLPGVGQVIYEPQTGDPGIVDGIPLYQSAFDGEFASKIAQFTSPKFDVVGWEVAHHSASDLTLDMDLTFSFKHQSYEQWNTGESGIQVSSAGRETLRDLSVHVPDEGEEATAGQQQAQYSYNLDGRLWTKKPAYGICPPWDDEFYDTANSVKLGLPFMAKVTAKPGSSSTAPPQITVDAFSGHAARDRAGPSRLRRV